MTRINNTNNLLTILKFLNNIDYYPILSFFSYPILLPPNNQFIQQTNTKQQTTKEIPSTRISTRLLLSLLFSPLPSSPFHPLPSLTTHSNQKTLFLLSFPPSPKYRKIERTKTKKSKCLSRDLLTSRLGCLLTCSLACSACSASSQ